MLKRFALIGMAIGALALGSSAEAALMTGGLSLSSQSQCAGCNSVLPVNSAGTQVSLGSATALDFTTTGAVTLGVAGVYHVDNTSGDFSATQFNTTGTIKDFTFSGVGNANYPSPPVATFESGVNGFSFDLSTIFIVQQNSSQLTLQGTGVFHMTGFDATPGIFNFQTNQAGGVFAFAASEATVPEPGSMVLLGTGLLGLGASVRRRFRKA